jgi:hypothetical protein
MIRRRSRSHGNNWMHAADRIVETTDPRSAEIRKSHQTEEVLLWC